MGEISNTRSKPRPNTNHVENHNGRDCAVAYGIEPGAAQRLDPTKRIWLEQSPTLRAKAGDNQASVAYAVENHPNDSRVKIREDNICQSLTGRMGTGGGNVPMILEIKDDEDADREKIFPLGRG